MRFGDKVREESLRPLDMCRGRDTGYIGQRMVNVKMPEEKRKTTETHGCSEG